MSWSVGQGPPSRVFRERGRSPTSHTRLDCRETMLANDFQPSIWDGEMVGSKPKQCPDPDRESIPPRGYCIIARRLSKLEGKLAAIS